MLSSTDGNEIASDLAGFTMGQADLLRRAMGRKAGIIAAQKKAFYRSRRRHEEKAGSFDLMAALPVMGLTNHSAAYALLAYQTAYLKAHYPVAFMSALLSV